ncbi:Carboxypeptidase regulatory-like domain-containing protein [Halpernia humi]|uniref:Carboxypeptidase regulatory-like domain-containing protein n=1 Tax=Halpernia humi TaxID=493375 RepID=A0A1H6ACL7_9FLAO|nr:TonB-dependent receptor [Halpernia humi]SEG46499.1 Carboxypeptidase regulatory-like domain-containing protein [Halpernia humi]
MKFFLLFVLFFSLKIPAQTEIKGFVFSENKAAISKANVILLNDKNQIETFAFSTKDGSFSLNTDKFGKFKVQITAFNFSSKDIEISISQKNQVLDLKTIVLEKVKEIKEVVITRTNPIRIKKDTIEYNVKNFANGTEQNVEELLKKIPGLTVQSNGKIKFGNKDVTKVLVENDDLFENGYQTLTQNMPSQPLDKIQVLKHYSKNKLLKGVENSESIAINLTLKKDAKSQWFGNVLLASTSYKENRHQAKINIMNFSKRQKIYALFNANNLGLNEMSGVEYLINPTSDNNVENVGSDISTISIINLHQKNQQFEDKRTNFNNDKLASLNYIYNFENDWKLKFVTIFNETQNRNYINSFYKFNYDGLNFTNIEDKSWEQNKRNIVGKLELSKDFKNKSNLQFYNKISSLNENNDNQFIFNNQPNNQLGTNQLFATENKVVYTKKLDSSHAIVAVAKYLYQNRPYNFTDENDVFTFLLNNPNAKRINQKIDSKLNFGGVKISYLKKYAEDNTLEIQLGNEFRKDYLNSDLSVFDLNNQQINFDKSQFQNNVNYTRNNTFAQLKYQKKSKKWTYGFTLLNQLISSNLNNDAKTGFYVSPNFNLSYENRKTGNFNLFASRKISTISINDVFVNYIYQGNRSFKQSDIGFTILPDYNLGLSYSLGDMLSEYLTLNLNFSRNEDYISNNTIVNPNYTFNQNILVKNNSTISSNLELRKYVKLIKSRISLLGNYLNSDYENSINNQGLIKTNFSNLKLGFEMKSGWTGFANYELGYNWTFNKIISDINSTNYLDQKGFLNLYFTINPQIRVESTLEYYKFGNTAQKTTQFLDVKLNYNVKKYKMNLFLQGNNLLNSNSIQRYSIDNISESLCTQRLLPLHIVLGINKNF